MWFNILISIVFGLLIIQFLFWAFRKNRSVIDPSLKMTTRTLVNDKWHNSNTSLTYWNKQFWLVFIQSPFHFFCPKSKLIVMCSKDTKAWTFVNEFHLSGIDVRDPKLTVIKDKLFLYFYKSAGVNPLPYMTSFTSTDDGKNWGEIADITSASGWLIWTPKTLDNVTWYASAHKIKEGKTMLFSTLDGIEFSPVSVTHVGKTPSVDEVVDESDFGFLDDGTIISTQRLEFSDRLLGDHRASTNISKSLPPYTTWTDLGKDFTTRLDGPSLFSYKGNVYAAGRNHVKTDGIIHHKTSIFTRKRTSIYLVSTKGLVHLTDLLSSGDTAYCGSVIHSNCVFVSYYSNNIKRDWPWIVGMCLRSSIHLSEIDLDSLDRLSKVKLAEYENNNLFQLVTKPK